MSSKVRPSSSRRSSKSSTNKNDSTGNSNNEDQVIEAEINAGDDLTRDPPAGMVKLRPSVVSFLPATIFCEYPLDTNQQRNDQFVLEELKERKMYYKSHWERTVVKSSFKRAGFIKTANSKLWTGMWSKHQTSEVLMNLNCLQKVNHFPNSWCVGRKDRLSKLMNTMKRLFGRDVYDFHPDTFILPNDKENFMRIIKNESSSNSRFTSGNPTGFWIVKPVASSCGRGISVMTTSSVLKTIEKHENKIQKMRDKNQAANTNKLSLLIQRYVANPYLIDNHKFDLRIYVLVTGVDPLRIYVFEDGLTRISTSSFSLKNIHNKFAHLTNYSINKKNDIFKEAEYRDEAINDDAEIDNILSVFDNTNDNGNEDNDDNEGDENEEQQGSSTSRRASTSTSTNNNNNNNSETEGFKWTLKAFKKWLTNQTCAAKVAETFQRINDIIIKTFIAAESEITSDLYRKVKYRTNCFELFGCDILLDSNLVPSLLEVNVSPSLMANAILDKKLKCKLISDTLHVVGLYPNDNKILKRYSKQHRDLNSGNTEPNNPFAFVNLNKLMTNQETYRKNPCPATVDLSLLNHTLDNNTGNSGDNAETCAWYQLVLSFEDEISRASSSGFQLLFPKKSTLTRYTPLFRHPRFTDHLLGKWILLDGLKGPAAHHLPSFIKNELGITAKKPRTLSAGTSRKSTISLASSTGSSKAMTQQSPNVKKRTLTSPIPMNNNNQQGRQVQGDYQNTPLRGNLNIVIKTNSNTKTDNNNNNINYNDSYDMDANDVNYNHTLNISNDQLNLSIDEDELQALHNNNNNDNNNHSNAALQYYYITNNNYKDFYRNKPRSKSADGRKSSSSLQVHVNTSTSELTTTSNNTNHSNSNASTEPNTHRQQVMDSSSNHTIDQSHQPVAVSAYQRNYHLLKHNSLYHSNYHRPSKESTSASPRSRHHTDSVQQQQGQTNPQNSSTRGMKEQRTHEQELNKKQLKQRLLQLAANEQNAVYDTVHNTLRYDREYINTNDLNINTSKAINTLTNQFAATNLMVNANEGTQYTLTNKIGLTSPISIQGNLQQSQFHEQQQQQQQRSSLISKTPSRDSRVIEATSPSPLKSANQQKYQVYSSFLPPVSSQPQLNSNSISSNNTNIAINNGGGMLWGSPLSEPNAVPQQQGQTSLTPSNSRGIIRAPRDKIQI